MTHATLLNSEYGPPQKKQSRRRPRGPRWYTAIENTLRLLFHPLDFLMDMHKRYGDVVSLPTLFGRLYAVFHPNGVQHILQKNYLNYNKDLLVYHLLSLVLGKGLLSSDGQVWLRQRRLIQPAFHHQRITAFGRLITETTLMWLEQWEKSGYVKTGDPLSLAHEIQSLTLNIVSKALLGTGLSEETTAKIERALTTVSTILAKASYFPLLLSLPTPQRRRLYAARGELYAIVDGIIRERRHSSEKHEDLLDMLLQAHDEETGEGMTDQQVRDEVLTSLLAGHETTANALCWTFFLLTQHPHIERKLREEYLGVLHEHPPMIEDLSRLPYNRMVIEEAMRLYPPAWAIGRRALGDDEVGDFSLPKGAYVSVSPYVTHRHPAFWERPDEFDPERFSSEQAAQRPRFAYFPFGGGPHLCIGNQFALSEAQLILATILSHYHLQPIPDTVITPDPLLTLRQRGDLQVTLHRRVSKV